MTVMKGGSCKTLCTGLGEKSFIFLLGLDEGLLEQIGIYFLLAGKLKKII